MKPSLLRRGLFLVAMPAAAIAQSAQTAQPPSQTTSATPVTYGPATARYEVTLGGSGASNQDFDASLGGFNLSLGQYVTDTLLGGIRQNVNYANPDVGDSSWNGSTFLFVDQHFGLSAARPFIGVNVGRVYGENVNDAWAAGLEGGIKYYVQSRTFVYAQLQYAWSFDDSDDIEDTFSDGQYLWSVGMGYNF